MKYVKKVVLIAITAAAATQASAAQNESARCIEPASQLAFCKAHSLEPCLLSGILSFVETDFVSDDLLNSRVNPAAMLDFCEANEIAPCSGSAVVARIQEELQNDDLSCSSN